MSSHSIERKPTWWLLYTNGAALVALVGLLEVSMAGEAARLVLELGAVVLGFVLMLCWLRVNRGRIELAETRATRRDAAELTPQNGSPPSAPSVAPRMWLLRPSRGGHPGSLVAPSPRPRETQSSCLIGTTPPSPDV